MANATNIAARQFVNGTQTIGWTNLSSSNINLYAGKVSDSANDVIEMRFTLASAASSITFTWYTTADTNKGKPMYYHIGTSESSTYQNATNSNHGDGTLTTTGYGFTAQSNTISGNFSAGTYYLYIWQGPTSGSDTYIHTSVFFSSAAYPLSISYAAVQTYTLSASVGTGVSLAVTITSSPYGRSGTLSPGQPIMHGEVLRLNWTLTTGYNIGTHTVNGTTFSQGASTGAVSFNVSIVLTAVQAVAVFNSVPSSYTTGTASTITVTRYSASYTNSIEVIQGGSTRETLSLTWSGNNGSVSWTPSAATYAPLNTSGGSVNVTLRLLTKSGATTIGYRDASATISFDSSADPTPNLAIADANGYLATYGAYVQNRSQFQVTVTDNVKYGASVSSRSTTANGATYSGQTFTTAPIAQSGYNTIEVTVRDSRGRTGTYTQGGINVLAYSAPYCPVFTAHRTDSSGNLDDTGSYFTVDWEVAITPLNNHNSRTLVMSYKETSAGTWTAGPAITLTSYTDSGTTSPVAISTERTYDIRLVVTDDFGPVTQTAKLSTIPATLDLLDGGFGVAIGKVAETANLLDVAWSMRVAGDTQMDDDLFVTGDVTATGDVIAAGSVAAADGAFSSSLSVGGNVLVNGSQKPKVVVAEGNSGIWHYVKYSDGTAECWGTATGTTSTWTAWGSMQNSNTIPASAPAFPFTFTSIPQVAVGFWSTLQTVGYFCNLGATVSAAPTYVAMRPTAGNTGGVVSVCYYVWGHYA